MKKIIIVFLSITNLCIAQDTLEQFSNGYLDIPWESSFETVQGKLKEKGIKFELKAEDNQISFKNEEVTTILTFHENMFASFTRSYIHSDPEHKPQSVWDKKIREILKDQIVDTSKIKSSLSVSISRGSGGGKSFTLIGVTYRVQNKKIMALKRADAEKEKELKRKAEEELYKKIAEKLLNP